MRAARWLVVVSSVTVALVAACGGDDESGQGTPPLEPASGIVDDAGQTDTTSDAGGGNATDASAPSDVGASQSYSGQATYYKATGTGACGQAISDSQLVGAMNKAQYGKSVCGKCVSIKGPNGTVVVKIQDECPGCAYGDIDLSSTAFAKIAKLSDGRVKITWSFVACP